MKLCTIVLTGLTLAAGALGASALQEGMAPAARGPEHAVLKRLAGNFDAEVDFSGSKSKGSQTTKLAMNDLWVVSDFTGTMMGDPFTGHEVLGYDPNKKKYVACWVDSMTPSMTLTEGTWDEATQTLTLSGDSHDPMGGKVLMVNKVKVTDDDHHVFTMHMGSADEPAMMTITYVRKK